MLASLSRLYQTPVSIIDQLQRSKTDNGPLTIYSLSFDFGAKSLVELPQYFKTHGYNSPNNPTAGPFQHAFATNLETFAYWATLPEVMQNFNTYMTGNESTRLTWIDWYPIEERLLRGIKSDDDAVVMIDIAGGRGHYLAAFKEKFPHIKGRFILQEVPDVIDDIQTLDSSIERMRHDMFTPQPIKGNKSTSNTKSNHLLNPHIKAPESTSSTSSSTTGLTTIATRS